MKFILFFLTFTTSSFAANPCSEPQWIEKPTLKKGKFEAKLTSTCTYEGKVNLKEGEAHFLKETQTKSDKIFEGPKSIQNQNKNGTFFDVLTQVPEGTIRSHVVVFEPYSRTLSYFTKSVKINLGGFAGYLKNLDLQLDVENVNEKEFKIVLKNRIVVEKPWIAPDLAFKPIAEKTAKDQFLKNRDEMLSDLVKALRK